MWMNAVVMSVKVADDDCAECGWLVGNERERLPRGDRMLYRLRHHSHPLPATDTAPRIGDLASQPWGLRGMRAADGCGCYGNEARTKFDSARRCLPCRVVGCVRRFLAGAE